MDRVRGPSNTEKGSSIGAEPSCIRRVTSLPESVYTEGGIALGDLQATLRRSAVVSLWRHVRSCSTSGPRTAPFSAAENWALVMALSKFGTFNGLSSTQSSVTDFAPLTQTPSFVNG